MKITKLKGKVQTVLGLIEADDLGVVLPHEHIFWDLRSYLIEPSKSDDRKMVYQRISLHNLSWVRSHIESSLDNLRLTDEKTAIGEVKRFKKAGGNTIVDVTPDNIGRNPLGLVSVAQATGLNIIMGTAYYIERSYHPEMNMDSRTKEDIAEEFMRDILLGVGNSGVRAGIIGEIGCSWPLTENERKVLRAAVMAQQHTGVALTVHPGRHKDAPLDIANKLIEIGADPARTVIDHIDDRIPIQDRRTRSKIAEMGYYLEFDLFGFNGLYPQLTPEDKPSDSIRISEIMELISDGYLNQILISQDISLKVALSCFGGIGYSHILDTTLPLMRQKGMTEEQIQTIMIENPKRLLCCT